MLRDRYGDVGRGGSGLCLSASGSSKNPAVRGSSLRGELREYLPWLVYREKSRDTGSGKLLPNSMQNGVPVMPTPC